MKYLGKNNEYFEAITIDFSNKKMVEHSRPSELILLCFESNNKIQIDGIDYAFQKGEIVCLTEFHKIKIHELEKAHLIKWNKFFYCIINHDSAVGCKGILFYGATSLPVIRPQHEDIASISAVWKSLEDEIETNDELQGEMLEVSLKRLLILCTRVYKSQSDFQKVDTDNADIIREYHYLVEQHFKQKHTVADYAELMFKSAKTLSNTFKKLGSKSPLQYIKDRKMLEAKRLLSYSNMSISEVGYELGFQDIQSFSRFFKREQGISPNQFKA